MQTWCYSDKVKRKGERDRERESIKQMRAIKNNKKGLLGDFFFSYQKWRLELELIAHKRDISWLKR